MTAEISGKSIKQDIPFLQEMECLFKKPVIATKNVKEASGI